MRIKHGEIIAASRCAGFARFRARRRCLAVVESDRWAVNEGAGFTPNPVENRPFGGSDHPQL